MNAILVDLSCFSAQSSAFYLSIGSSDLCALTRIRRAGRSVGVTVIVVALRRRTIVALYSSFPQLRELKLLNRHCTPTIEVVISFIRVK